MTPAGAGGTLGGMGKEESLERAVTGALRGAIRDHGPITGDLVTSAAKRVIGNLKNARLGGIAAALGRQGGLANTKKAQAAKGRKGGRAGKGSKKPHSEEARRRSLARRLIRAAGTADELSVASMVRLAPDRPHLHRATSLQRAASDLLVADLVQELLGIEWPRRPRGRPPEPPADEGTPA